MKIKPDQSKSYMSAHRAILDAGFEEEGEFSPPVNPIIKRPSKRIMIYRKNGNFYRFKKMDHFNTTIYEIEMVKVNNLGGYER